MHSIITPGILKSDTDDTLLHIPEHLQQCLTATEKPQEVYHLVEREHDRRIRLLLRRFTNQIQYGCTNPRCNVPTCLSYRKRASPGPLRPHTDLTARALAVKCLEQYASHGRDLGRYSNRDKGKKKQPISESDGLCWNEPVIPWYSDPSEHLAKRNAATRRRSSQGNGHTDPALRKGFNITITNGTNLTTSPSRNKQKESPDFVKADMVADLRPVNVEQSLSDRSNGERKSVSILHPESTSVPGKEDKSYTNGHVIEPVGSEKKNISQRHDQASFTQSLFKHPRLQTLERPAAIPLNAQENAIENQGDNRRSNISKQSLDTKLPLSTMGLILSNQSIATFRILPPRAIEWFRKVFAEHQETGDVSPDHLNSFLNQSLFFVLSDPIRLLQSASTWNDPKNQIKDRDPSVSSIDSSLILPSYHNVVWVCNTIAQCFESFGKQFHVVTYLLQALQHCYQLPPNIKQPSSLVSATRKRYSSLTNLEVAHLLLLTLSMIRPIQVYFYRIGTQQNYEIELVRDDETFFDLDSNMIVTRQYRHQVNVFRLCECIADVISHRIAMECVTEGLTSRNVDTNRSRGIIPEVISLMHKYPERSEAINCDNYRAFQMLISMKFLILGKWDRMPVIRRTGPIGGALELLKGLYLQRRDLGLKEAEFCIDSIPDALDEVEMPYQWLSFKPDATKMHILQFSFLFPPKVIVRYFRSLNLKVMKQSHEKAMAVYANGKAQLLHGPWSIANIDEVFDQTRAHMARYFVMTIRRSHILEDAIGQIWHRERQELMRPLKVTLGKDEGENGLDHGGVQQEFFRLVFAEAFNPEYGMFDVDPTNHTAWFKPGSMEPLYKYEALGILMSLAIYNGVTIPITMPLAFYRKILGLKVKTIDHIEDGWPEIAKSFRQLLAWEDGDVEDVMALNYEFSYDSFGKPVTIDMSRPQPDKQKRTKVKPAQKEKRKQHLLHKQSPKMETNPQPESGKPPHSTPPTSTATQTRPLPTTPLPSNKPPHPPQ